MGSGLPTGTDREGPGSFVAATCNADLSSVSSSRTVAFAVPSFKQCNYHPEEEVLLPATVPTPVLCGLGTMHRRWFSPLTPSSRHVPDGVQSSSVVSAFHLPGTPSGAGGGDLEIHKHSPSPTLTVRDHLPESQQLVLKSSRFFLKLNIFLGLAGCLS